MTFNDPQFAGALLELIEGLGTLAFAISGIRHAAEKHFDWFGGYVCGFAVAIGGGTIRDTILGVKPFWTTDIRYLFVTAIALFLAIILRKRMKKLNNAWFVFDTLGLAFFTIAGMQKTLTLGFPFWVAIVMGCITGVAGGVIRDVLLNNEPVILQKEIYAIASVAGGVLYWILLVLNFSITFTVITTFILIVLIRFVAVYYHIQLPILRDED